MINSCHSIPEEDFKGLVVVSELSCRHVEDQHQVDGHNALAHQCIHVSAGKLKQRQKGEQRVDRGREREREIHRGWTEREKMKYRGWTET